MIAEGEVERGLLLNGLGVATRHGKRHDTAHVLSGSSTWVDKRPMLVPGPAFPER